MQDIFYVGLFAIFPEWDIGDMLNGVNYVIPNFHIVGLFGLSQLSKPIFMRRHLIGHVKVEKPYIFRIVSVVQPGCRHCVCYVPHYEHTAMIVVLRIRGVVGKFSTYGSWFLHLLLIIFFTVAKLILASSFDQIVLTIWFGMMAPPSVELSSCVSSILPVVGVAFLGWPTISALSELASTSSVVCSSFIQLRVNHVTFRCISFL